ncbi:MAG: hypothetical protein A2351_02925 [Omnitrophica bacterium RIFOXYB12_FULL_50_7]|nr:MAG: hypothetical protein A2351_02925 [Omnitrophica bacterium RIFOXYB12_FULL_50_7]
MSDEIQYSLEKLGKALASLKEGAEQAADDLSKDGVIQRFEFTFELLWKTLRIFLEEVKGIQVRNPKDSLKAAFKEGLIDDEKVFLNMLEDRNRSSHIYNKEESQEIFKRVKSDYLPAVLKVLNTLKEKK